MDLEREVSSSLTRVGEFHRHAAQKPTRRIRPAGPAVVLAAGRRLGSVAINPQSNRRCSLPQHHPEQPITLSLILQRADLIARLVDEHNPDVLAHLLEFPTADMDELLQLVTIIDERVEQLADTLCLELPSDPKQTYSQIVSEAHEQLSLLVAETVTDAASISCCSWSSPPISEALGDAMARFASHSSSVSVRKKNPYNNPSGSTHPETVPRNPGAELPQRNVETQPPIILQRRHNVQPCLHPRKHRTCRRQPPRSCPQP